MDLARVLAELRAELANVDAVILSLEQLQQVSGAHRRGRPPKLLSDLRKAGQAKPLGPAGQAAPPPGDA